MCGHFWNGQLRRKPPPSSVRTASYQFPPLVGKRMRRQSPLLVPAGLLLALVVALFDPHALPIAPALAGERWLPARSLFGIARFVSATFAVAGGALVLALPAALASALATHLWPRHGGVTLRRLTLVAGAIPSVVWGFWGLAALAPLLSRWHPPGQGLLAATIVLALMIWPTMALALDAALERIPDSRRLAALSLGMTLGQRLRLVVMPSLRHAATGAALLGLTRAMGETMAVLMVSGNVGDWPTGPFASIRTVTANLALEFAYAQGAHRDALLLSGLMLIVTTTLLFWWGRRLVTNQ
ncbi:MAG: ABC transporter permease subunit [Candidatus Dadabacteria bacterium]|nr:MAG: ABC transporter permease subunit [Candidatus Dadabacteria bacterium]